MLSAAKHLCAHRARPFAEFTLSETNVLRVTTGGSRQTLAEFTLSEANVLRVTRGNQGNPLALPERRRTVEPCHAERSEASLCPSHQTFAEFTLSGANVLRACPERSEGVTPFGN